MKTRGHRSPLDGPNHSTRPNEGTPFQSRIEFQAGYTQLACSTGANASVMVIQCCKSTPQKSRPVESGHGRHAMRVAIECSYKLSQKNYGVN